MNSIGLIAADHHRMCRSVDQAGAKAHVLEQPLCPLGGLQALAVVRRISRDAGDAKELEKPRDGSLEVPVDLVQQIRNRCHRTLPQPPEPYDARVSCDKGIHDDRRFFAAPRQPAGPSAGSPPAPVPAPRLPAAAGAAHARSTCTTSGRRSGSSSRSSLAWRSWSCRRRRASPAEGQIVLAMSLMATMLFITEPMPLPTVPLLIIIGQVVLLRLDSDQGGQEPDDRFRPVHHGLADAGGGHRQAEARQAHRLVDRADDRHQRLLDQLRHHAGVRRARRLHRRAHGGGHDAAGRRHAHQPHLERSQEGPQSRRRDLLSDLLWLLHRRRSARLRAGRATPSSSATGRTSSTTRRTRKPHRYLDGLPDLDRLRLPDVPAAAADRHGAADLDLQAGILPTCRGPWSGSGRR